MKTFELTQEQTDMLLNTTLKAMEDIRGMINSNLLSDHAKKELEAEIMKYRTLFNYLNS